MAQTFEFGRGHTFVSGLFWLPLPGTVRDYKKETLKFATEMQCDLAVWRTTNALQVGLGSTTKGLKPGQLSAAAVVSKTLEVEPGAKDFKGFLCATEVPGGSWLYVAQRDGIILPDGDFIGTEDEVRSRMLHDFSMDGWDIVIAPEHWGMRNARERKFEEFIPKKAGKNDYKKWWGLTPVKRNAVKALAPVVVLAVALAVAFVGYQKWQERRAAEELARIALEQQNAAKQQPIEHPWKKQPKANQFQVACTTAFTKVKTLWPGNWLPRDATCNGSVFTVVWLRQPTGWIDHLLAIEPKAVLSLDGSMASLSVPLTLKSGDDEKLPAENARILQLHGASQRYGFKVAISAAAQAPVLPGDKQAAQPLREWKEMTWKVDSTALPPPVLVRALDGPGFRIAKIVATLKGGVITWDMEGTQYVQQ